MAVRGALAVLVVLLLSAAAEATNYQKYNSPTWGSRWKQILRNKTSNYMHPYIAGR
jgi:hypothetical protein